MKQSEDEIQAKINEIKRMIADLKPINQMYDPQPAQIKYLEEMPAGTYIIGDPGYFVPDLLWLEYCDIMSAYDKQGRGAMMFGFCGHSCAASETAYGDGVFKSDFGVSLGVDTGTIAATPLELIGEHYKLEGYGPDYNNGVLHRFDKPFKMYYDSGEIILDDGNNKWSVFTG